MSSDTNYPPASPAESTQGSGAAATVSGASPTGALPTGALPTGALPTGASPTGAAGGPRAAFWILRVGFVVLPIWMGLDKFINALTDWPTYLAPWIVDLIPFSAQTAMYIVGVVEIVAGIAVALKPRYAAWVVTAWLAGIIINLLSYSGFYDVALRDFGLLVAAVALAMLSQTYDRGAVVK